MASSEDFQTAICSGGGWWNAGRGLCPPCAAPLSDFMWSDSSLNDMDEQGEMKQAAATYSRSDDSSDDHHSSSAHQHLPVLSSDYAQIFQHVQKPPEADFCVSDWSKNFLMHDQNNNNNNQGFYDLGQFDTTAKVSQMGLDNIASSSYLYPAILQSLTGPDTDMNYGFDNRFGPSTTNLMQQQQQFYATTLSPKQHLNSGTKPSNNNSLMPFWDSWMGSDEIGTPESHQIPAPAMFEDRKPYICGNTITGRSFISSKVSSNDLAQKVAGSNLLGTKRKNTSTSDDLYKRLRMETPSSLPTFKVRKEKLGDRITALQQLVSPFGKTDTASVLHEAIEYIKFLHDQVCVLRTPYMQNGAPTDHHQQQMQKCESKNPPSEGPKQDLRSRGLCLVPISSTFPLTTETAADFWTPTFGGTIAFR